MEFLKDAVDVHCHIIETPETLEQLENVQTGTMIVMTCKPKEWPVLQSFAETNQRVVPCYGVHPWFTSKERDWKDQLNHFLKDKKSLVGEIGLDKVAVDLDTKELYPMEEQLKAFHYQMDLAIQLNKPVSIHNVQTHGPMSDYFRELDKRCQVYQKWDRPMPCPPAIMMHSFTASSEVMKSLVGLKAIGSKFFFSFSWFVNGRSPKSRDRIKNTPDDQILVESDMHDIRDIDESMSKIIHLVSEIKGWTVQETVRITSRNALRFLNAL
ncbi:hypothetical protein EDD86DRAFT_271008 [Gorgonomyces haynaldii]|nr:hypothetical protein EDD86DRAFT_271008 [Gorgonomyces haynaldii]